MSKFEERQSQFVVSLINEPLIDFEVAEPVDALGRARARWGRADLIESGRSQHERTD